MLTPDFDQKTGQLTLKSIGVGLASTFPGFCSEHEKLFEEFEKPRKLETSKHFSLQIYRAICREAFRTSVLAKQTKSLIESYVKLRNEGLKDLIFKKFTQNGFPDDSNFKSLSVRNDPLIESSNEKIAVIEALFSHINEKLIPAIEKLIFSNDGNDIYINVIDIDTKIPAALTGCASFHVNDNGVVKQVFLIITKVSELKITINILINKEISALKRYNKG